MSEQAKRAYLAYWHHLESADAAGLVESYGEVSPWEELHEREREAWRAAVVASDDNPRALSHRPSRLDSKHTACGLAFTEPTILHLGDGETCAQCTHVVAQVAAAVRGEPSWANR